MRFLILVACLAIAAPAFAQTLVGAARIVDGDSLVVDGKPVRLIGIDAPELDQTCTLEGVPWQCGEEAKQQLLSVIGAQPVTCIGHGLDRNGRLLARCTANGFELGGTMVEYGWAMAFRRYSEEYVPHETRAKSQRMGIWRSEFVRPEIYRSAQTEERSPTPSRPTRERATGDERTGCRIKGNRSRRGEWIYHLPGMQYYDQTRAEEIFCSEADARAAGYRRSKV